MKKCSTSIELCIRNRKTAARIAASEAHWEIPSSPIVREQQMVSVCKLFKSKRITNIYIYKAI